MNYKFKSNTDYFLFEDRRILTKYAEGKITALEAMTNLEQRHGRLFYSVEEFRKWAKGIGYEPTEFV